MWPLHAVVEPLLMAKRPPGQSAHCAMPGSDWNLPGAHSAHVAFTLFVLPSGPNFPAGHGRPAQYAEPMVEYMPAWHNLHGGTDSG